MVRVFLFDGNDACWDVDSLLRHQRYDHNKEEEEDLMLLLMKPHPILYHAQRNRLTPPSPSLA